MAVKKPEALAWDKPPKPSTAPRALSNMIQHVHLIISDHFPQKKVRKNSVETIEMNEIQPAGNLKYLEASERIQHDLILQAAILTFPN